MFIRTEYDKNNTRFRHVQTNSDLDLDWLIIPGGPGMDSRYMISLVEKISLPGRYWIIDFDSFGDNAKTNSADHSLEQCKKWLIDAAKKFEKPIIIGHSFGGMLTMLEPTLKNCTRGLIYINTSPTLWIKEQEQVIKNKALPDVSTARKIYDDNPCAETTHQFLMQVSPIFFPHEKSRKQGEQLLDHLPHNINALDWWIKAATEMPYSAQWIPQNIPTLIIGSDSDYVTPFSLFMEDERFKRENISFASIPNAGHFAWVDQPDLVKKAINTWFYENEEYLLPMANKNNIK